MADEKAITEQVPANTIQKPEVNLVKSDFDALIEQKGYDVYHDHAAKCPCSSKDGGANQPTCQNCGGSGWFYVNRIKTRMVFQSMNANTKLKEWSEERLGTANITARAEDRLSYMDRITLIDSESEHSQVVFLKKQPDTSRLYGTLRYNPIEFYSVFLYRGTTQRHELLIEGTDFTIDRNQIKLLLINDGDIENPTISVRYRHQAEYTVIDLPRDVIVSTIKDECTRKNKDVQFPISAVARRSHYMIDRNNYTNDNLFDNSFPSEFYLKFDSNENEFVETSSSSIDEDAYIQISFQADADHIVENIDFSIANNFDFDDFRVNKYTLRYQINSGTQVTLLDGVDISGTSPSSPDIQSLTSSINLVNGDIFSLYWYPHDADSIPQFSTVGIHIKDSTVKIYNSSQTLCDWNIVGDVNNFVVGNNISGPTYSIGTNLSLVNYANSGVLWEGAPISVLPFFPDSLDDLDIEVHYEMSPGLVTNFIISQGQSHPGYTHLYLTRDSQNRIELDIRDNSLQHYNAGGISIPDELLSSKKISLLGSTNQIDVLIDGVVIGTIDTTGSDSISDLNEYNLMFGGFNGPQAVSGYNGLIDYIRIQNEAWDFLEGRGSITYSDKGTQSNLRSNKNEELMWQIKK